MEHTIQSIEHLLLLLSERVPLELFVFVGALAEEVIAPIPSMLIMTTAGWLAQLDGHTPFFLFWLVLIGNLGKLIGSIGWYVVGDKLEDVVIGRLGRFFGLTHGDIERVGARLSGHEWRDGAIIFGLRCLPFFPSLAVSVAAGVLKIELRTFALASYCGNAIKDAFYIVIGYFGAQAFRTFLLEVERVRFGLGVLIGVATLAVLIVAYRKRHHGLHLLTRVLDWAKERLRPWLQK